MISAQMRKMKCSFLCWFPKKKSASFLGGYHVSLLQFYFSTIPVPENPSSAKTPKKLEESIGLFFKEKGFSDTQLARVLKGRQQLRSANLETSIKPKIEIFQEFGFSNPQIAQIISRDPSILCCSVTNRIRPSLSLLFDLLGSSDHVFKVLRRSWTFFTRDMKKTLFPNIEFLKSYGVPMDHILHLLRSLSPSLFIKPELLRKHVEKLERMGMDSSSKMFIYSLWAVASMSDQVWELKMRTFRDLGFTESEIVVMFRKAPLVFVLSPEKIKSVAAAVLDTNIYTLSSIMAHPLCFCRSLEKRLKPRLQVLEILDERKVIKKWPRLGTVCIYSDERFHEAFVAPFPELLKGITFPSSIGCEKNNSSILIGADSELHV